MLLPVALAMSSGSSKLDRMSLSLMALLDDIGSIVSRLDSTAGTLRAARSRLETVSRQYHGGNVASLSTALSALEMSARQCVAVGEQLNGARAIGRSYIAARLAGNDKGPWEQPATSLTSSTAPSRAEFTQIAPHGPGSEVVLGLRQGEELVPLTAVSIGGDLIPADLFEREPAKGGASKADMIWAAECFRDVVVPHIAAGGTREQLSELDNQDGSTGFRRREGAWDLYLGSDNARVDLAPYGSVVGITNGRHRILAAYLAGLPWIPMRVCRLNDEQAARARGNEER